MSKMRIKITLMMVFLGLGFSSEAHVALDSPIGGEMFIGGETVIIQWHETVTHNTLNWDLYFSSNGGMTWEIIGANVPIAISSYQWTVPQTNTTQGRIKVVQDNSEMDYNDFCENFTILPGPPQVLFEAQDLTLECSVTNEATINTWLDNHGGAIVNSLCGSLTWENNYTELSDECGLTGSALVIFTVTDSCDHSTMIYASVEVIDNNLPTIPIPAQSISVQCDGAGNIVELNAWLNSHGGASSSDACGTISWSHILTNQSGTCGSSFSTFAVFIVTDACGGMSTTSAEFTAEDSNAPEILIHAQNLIVNCEVSNFDSSIQLWLDNHGGSSANDLCGEITWINDFAPLSDSCQLGITLVRFTAIDGCGNSSTTLATLELTDNDIPTIEVPAQSMTVECDGAGNSAELNTWLDSHGGASGIVACGTPSWSHTLTTQTDNCGSSYSIFTVFTLTDSCGETNTTSAAFTVVDTTAPDILVPAQNMTIECNLPNLDTIIQLWLDNHGGSSATDVCGEITWINDFSPLVDNCKAAIIPVTFTAIDACGNSNSTTAMLTIEKTSGIHVLSEGLNVNVFPIPSREHLYVEFRNGTDASKTLLLFDLKGSLIWKNSNTANSWDIPTAEFYKGIYLLRIATSGGSLTQKVVIE